MSKTKFAALIATGAIVIGTLAGCSAPMSTSSSVTADKKPAVTETSPSPTREANTNATFGQTVTYGNKVSVTVSAPVPVTPGQYAAGDDQAANVEFTFTLTNNGDKNFNPLPYPKISSGSAESSTIFDMDHPEWANAPTTVLLPGKSVSWKQAFSVADPADMTLQIAPTMLDKDAIFTN